MSFFEMIIGEIDNFHFENIGKNYIQKYLIL